MTYFSDFETTEYMYDDYNARQTILKSCESVTLRDGTESVPDDLLEEFDDLY
jgi:hypothetical protein